jgi:hypothetical protein
MERLMEDEVLVKGVNALPTDDISPGAKAAMMHEQLRLYKDADGFMCTMGPDSEVVEFWKERGKS